MKYSKGRLLKDGGEGNVYEVEEDHDLLMKVYKETDISGSSIVTPDLQEKLEYMVANPPKTIIAQGQIAWPIELLKDEHDKLTGFIMPRLDMDEHLLRAYGYRHPTIDSADYDFFPSVRSRISIAINLCSALHELHKAGHIIGDFNHENIGVNYSTGQIYFMDCDSFHIIDNGNEFRTNVIMPGYLAPEIIAHCNEERADGKPYNLDEVAFPTFTKDSDNFCLAIHIFKLLMNGVDPFRGVRSEATGSTASPFVGNEAIERNAYVFREGNKPSAVFCPDSGALPPDILGFFNKTFIDGRADPSKRPSAEDWYYVLLRYLTEELAQCNDNAKHQYYDLLIECPYCAADDNYEKEHGGTNGGTQGEEPKRVPNNTPLEKITQIKRRARTLHLLISISLWAITAVVYILWNYATGNAILHYNPANWSGHEFIFVLAAFIECMVGVFIGSNQVDSLDKIINSPKTYSKRFENELIKYKRRLTFKIRLLVVATVVLALILLFASPIVLPHTLAALKALIRRAARAYFAFNDLLRSLAEAAGILQ